MYAGVSPQKRCFLVLVSPLCWLLASCSLVTPSPLHPVPGNPGIPTTFELQNVPFFPQEGDQCGPSSLATVLAYQGAEVSAESLRESVYLPGRKGSLQLEMVARARREGFLVYPLAPSMEAVLREVQGGHPVLVLQNLRFDWWPQWHYAVVIGYDLAERTISLRSGKNRRYVVNMALFEKTWSRGGRWSIVVTDPGSVPVTAQEAAFISSVHDLEQVGERKAAREGYGAALSRWPNSKTARFGLGNLAYREGQFLQSVQHFYQLTLTHPDFFPGWNNLAYGLDRISCKNQAVAAAECAVTVSARQDIALTTLEELRQGHDSRPAGVDCPQIDCPVGD